MPPNVLCVVLDTARADALEPYGAAPGSTPATAQLAARGVAMPGVYATACWTLPSHASMLTGLLPRAAGLAAPESEGRDKAAIVRSHADRLLPEVLRRAGYWTGAVSTNVWISKANGFATGFDEFVTVDTGRQARMRAGGIRDRLSWAREAVRAQIDDGAAEAGRVLREWIAAADGDAPHFWFVNLVECHSPYLPPRPYNDLGPVERARSGLEARRHLTLDAIWRSCVGDLQVPADALERMRHLYGRAVNYMDEWLAGVLEALDASGILEETLVLVTSDHGENFGEGGLIAHAFSLDDRLIRVPLVVAGPGSEAFEAPIASLAELPRRIADAIELPGAPWNGDRGPDGVAVAQFNPPVLPTDPRAREAVESWGLGAEAVERLTQRFEVATDGDLKLVRRRGGELVHDLGADPLELDPAPASAAIAESPGLRPRIEALRAGLDHPAATAELDGTGGAGGAGTDSAGPNGARRAAPGASSPGGTSSAEDAPSPEEVERIEERMRLLGYM